MTSICERYKEVTIKNNSDKENKTNDNHMKENDENINTSDTIYNLDNECANNNENNVNNNELRGNDIHLNNESCSTVQNSDCVACSKFDTDDIIDNKYKTENTTHCCSEINNDGESSNMGHYVSFIRYHKQSENNAGTNNNGSQTMNDINDKRHENSYQTVNERLIHENQDNKIRVDDECNDNEISDRFEDVVIVIDKSVSQEDNVENTVVNDAVSVVYGNHKKYVFTEECKVSKKDSDSSGKNILESKVSREYSGISVKKILESNVSKEDSNSSGKKIQESNVSKKDSNSNPTKILESKVSKEDSDSSGKKIQESNVSKEDSDSSSMKIVESKVSKENSDSRGKKIQEIQSDNISKETDNNACSNDAKDINELFDEDKNSNNKNHSNERVRVKDGIDDDDDENGINDNNKNRSEDNDVGNKDVTDNETSEEDMTDAVNNDVSTVSNICFYKSKCLQAESGTMKRREKVKVDETEPSWNEEAPFERRDVIVRKDRWITDLYAIDSLLGRGKFGEVKKCRERRTGRQLAAKFIEVTGPQDRLDIINELEIMKHLQHPRLLQLYDAFENRDRFCLVLELVLGGELFERVINEDFILTEKACVMFMRQICDGVAFMHSESILHLDMKPENILCLTREGNRIKIIDFGLARKYNPKDDLRVLFGTPEFVAPEVVNFDPICPPTDMWSVGVICYVLLSGLSPFMGDTEAETLSNVTMARWDFNAEEFDNISPEAKDFISKLLVKTPQKRISASDCLEHQWLRRSVKRENRLPERSLSKKRLRKFVYRRKWQKAINAMLALRRMGVSLC